MAPEFLFFALVCPQILCEGLDLALVVRGGPWPLSRASVRPGGQGPRPRLPGRTPVQAQQHSVHFALSFIGRSKFFGGDVKWVGADPAPAGHDRVSPEGISNELRGQCGAIVQTEHRSAARRQHPRQAVFALDPTREHRGATESPVDSYDPTQAREPLNDSLFAGLAPEIENVLCEKASPRKIRMLNSRQINSVGFHGTVNPRACGTHRFAERFFRAARDHAQTLFAPRNPNFQECLENFRAFLSRFVKGADMRFAERLQCRAQ